MNRGSTLAWLLLVVWATWLAALSGHWTQFAWPGRWAPELHTALFVALAARVAPSDIAKLALCVGVARVAVSVDPPAAALAAALATGALLRIARGTVQIENPVIGAGLAFGLCVASSWWFELVHARALAPEVAALCDQPLGWRAGCTTAIATAAFGGALARLPGIGSLVRRKAWAVGASLR